MHRFWTISLKFIKNSDFLYVSWMQKYTGIHWFSPSLRKILKNSEFLYIPCRKIQDCTNFQHIFWNSQNQWIPVSFKWSKNAKIPPKNSKSSEFLYISCPLSLGKKCTGTHLLSFLSIFGYFFENQWVPVCFLVTHRG